MAKKKATTTAKKGDRAGRLSGVVRYFKEMRAELKRVIWPSRRTTVNLTMIVLAVTVVMSITMGFLDWVFAKLFALIIS